MLTPEQLLEVAETLRPMLDDLNRWIVCDMVKRLIARMEQGRKLTISATDQWQLQVYQEAGGHLDTIQRQLSRFLALSSGEIAAIFEASGVTAYEADNAFYVARGLEDRPFELSGRMARIITDAYQRTNGELRNLTRITAQASQQRFVEVLDRAYVQVMSGAASYTTAVQEATRELVSVQTTVKYPSGHVDTIETAVLRAVRAGVAQASGNMAIQGMIDRDWDLIRVSAHIGARYGDGGENPGNHFWWQGKLYSRTGRTAGYPRFEEATGYGTGEGLCGWGCRHSFGPGDPDHNPYDTFDVAENKRVYDLSQKQRRREAQIRKNEMEMAGLGAAIDAAQDADLRAALQSDYDKAAVLLERRNHAYNDFCKENDLKRQGDRLLIARWNQAEARRAIAAARRAAK